jgi:predicted GIY-YIG superfamily endonuclease/glycine/D-amino acid oxidase-like deaminating enzyme
MYAIYILQCNDESYYTGLTNDLEKRIWQHETGFFPDCYTFKRRPIKLRWYTTVAESIEEAMKLEKQIKGWSRKKKEALMKGDIDELKKLSNEKKLFMQRPSASSGLNTLIIGQGISGTFLSYYLKKSGLSFIIIDEAKPNTASKAAAGIINPVTGRRIVKTWMIDELMDFALDAYQQIESELHINCISQKKIIDFFPTPQMRNAFLQRLEEDRQYLSLPGNENSWRENFKYDFGYGEIEPVYLVDVAGLISSFRKKMIEEKLLIEEHFDINKLIVSENKIQYKDILADKIIFCDGIESFNNPYFKNLPFAPNKGEALIVEINNIPDDFIFKKGMNIVPLKNNLFWVGSSYEWEFENNEPNKIFRERTELILLEWLKTSFKITDHISSIRPATLERRPFVGFHPAQKNVGILNGMGTKGCSLAPYFANQLVQNIINQSPIHREADINRFAKTLIRNQGL